MAPLPPCRTRVTGSTKQVVRTTKPEAYARPPSGVEPAASPYDRRLGHGGDDGSPHGAIATCARSPRPTSTCTSPGRCGTRRCSSWPSATASPCPTAWSRTGRRSSRPPTRRAGSGSSASTTSRARCCARPTTYAAWCSRQPRTTSQTAGGGSRSRSTRVGTPPASAASPPSPTWCSTASATPPSAPGCGMAVVIAANRTRHPLDARTLARLAGQYAGRGVVGFGLSNDERRGRHRRVRRRPSRSPSAPGCCSRRTVASCAGPSTSGSAWTSCTPTGSGHGVRAAEDPALLDRIVEAGVALEVCPVSNVALGVYSDLTSVPLPQLIAAGRHDRARRRRSAALRLAAGRPVRHDARRPRARRRHPGRARAQLLRGVAGTRRAGAPRAPAEIDAWLADRS